jgi:integrase
MLRSRHTTTGATLPKPTIQEAIPEYLAHLRARNLSEATIRTRRISLQELGRAAGRIVLWSVTARHLDKIFGMHPEWSAGTRNNRLSHYKHFLGWARARGYMHRDSDPLFGWKFAKQPVTPQLRIPVTEWGRLYNACLLPRERMVLSLGLFLFLRAGEIKTIQLKHVNLERNEVEIFRSKTQQWDTMPICSELDAELRRYLTWCANELTPNPNHHLIAASRVQAGSHGFIKGSIQYDWTRPYGQIHDVVQPILERAGYPTLNQGEHTLRRSGARAYFDGMVADGFDGALRRVQSMLGHSHSVMTERYLGLELDRHRRNSDLRGRPMFPDLHDAKIVPIRKEM